MTDPVVDDPRHWYRPGPNGALIPTGIAMAGHSERAQHGAAVAALVARALDTHEPLAGMSPVRLTIDLTRAVPFGVTHVEVTPARAGRRVYVAQATVLVDGVPTTRSEAQFIRGHPIEPAALPAPPEEAPTHPPDHPVPPLWGDGPFLRSLEMEWEHGSPGAGIYWLRLADAFVEGETMTPLQRTAAAADMVMTSSGAVPGYGLVNTDLTVSLFRQPVGEHIRVTSKVHVSAAGFGQSIGVLDDVEGPFARVAKSLISLGPIEVDPSVRGR